MVSRIREWATEPSSPVIEGTPIFGRVEGPDGYAWYPRIALVKPCWGPPPGCEELDEEAIAAQIVTTLNRYPRLLKALQKRTGCVECKGMGSVPYLFGPDDVEFEPCECQITSDLALAGGPEGNMFRDADGNLCVIIGRAE